MPLPVQQGDWTWGMVQLFPQVGWGDVSSLPLHYSWLPGGLGVPFPMGGSYKTVPMKVLPFGVQALPLNKPQG